MLAGMMQRPRATSLRINSGSRCSRLAMYSISSVMMPCRAKCICDILRLPFADAACASRLSIQSARTAMFYPQEKQDSRRARETRIAGCLVCKGELWHPARVGGNLPSCGPIWTPRKKRDSEHRRGGVYPGYPTPGVLPKEFGFD